MSEQFSAQVSNRICSHMNEDHADAVVLYAQAFGGLSDATAAEMLAIDVVGMDLMAQVNGSAVPVRIQFDHVLANSEDAHQTLIAMVKQARMMSKKS
jgi:putative heme iron utilization protein